MRRRRGCPRDCRYCRHSNYYKLHPDEARMIRKLHGRGVRPSLIAPRFGVSPQHVSNIGAGRRWADA